jgi:hypothetical protein
MEVVVLAIRALAIRVLAGTERLAGGRADVDWQVADPPSRRHHGRLMLLERGNAVVLMTGIGHVTG